ncbi:MAG: hypothetical protein ACI857_002997 [Arenicella sp.]|jgi:hypothetical protein
MVEVLVYTAVYGILLMGVLNFILIFIAGRKGIISFMEAVWMICGIAAVGMLAYTVTLRSIFRLDYLYYAGLTIGIFGMVGLFLSLTQRLIREGRPPGLR